MTAKISCTFCADRSASRTLDSLCKAHHFYYYILHRLTRRYLSKLNALAADVEEKAQLHLEQVVKLWDHVEYFHWTL